MVTIPLSFTGKLDGEALVRQLCAMYRKLDPAPEAVMNSETSVAVTFEGGTAFVSLSEGPPTEIACLHPAYRLLTDRDLLSAVRCSLATVSITSFGPDADFVDRNVTAACTIFMAPRSASCCGSGRSSGARVRR